MYLPTKGTLKKKKSAKDLFDDIYAIGAKDQQRIYLIMFM